MLHLRRRAAPLLAAATLALGLGTAIAATPAHALAFTQQCDQAGDCFNLWGGGYPVKIYRGTTANNEIAIQWLSGGGFELRDNLHGGCLGDLGNSPGNPQLQGGLTCPDSGHGAWGSIFYVAAQCSNGFSVYGNRHWSRVGYNPSNGSPVYANTQYGDCVKQESL